MLNTTYSEYYECNGILARLREHTDVFVTGAFFFLF